MAEPFNVNEYWLKRGQTYIQEERLGLEYHRIQERFLFNILRAGRIPMNKILELGCGFGRVTKLLATHFPGVPITALDLSPDQLANAKRYCAGGEHITFQSYDFYAGLPLPGSGYETALAIEVFLHHPRPIIKSLIEKLAAISRYMVNIDWSEAWPGKVPEHVWVHDYLSLYQEAGLNCATFLLPEKVDGKQQKLFVAGKELPIEIQHLERELNATILAAGVPPAPATSPISNREEWFTQLHLAQQEIRQWIPRGSRFILVNDDQWGNEKSLAEYHVVPFLEHAGQYWGAPADDVMAIGELERLRAAGADCLVFAWHSFWWLDHYRGFRQHLRASFPCPVENERLIIFNLR